MLGFALLIVASATALSLSGSYPVVDNGFATLQTSSVASPSHSSDRASLFFNDKREGAASWSSAHLDLNQWIQISTQKVVRWESILTQGRGDYDQWVTSFTIQYNLNGVDWIDYDDKRKFDANFDRNTVVTNNFDVALIARAIRLKPVSYHWWISMRLEAYVNDVIWEEPTTPAKRWVPAIDTGLHVTASSVFSPGFSPSRARLYYSDTNPKDNGQCWYPAKLDTNQWIQVSAVENKRWVKISTQGRGDYNNWLTSYYVTYTNNGVDWKMADNGKVFYGNSDRNTIISHEFKEPFEARAIRVHPVSWYQGPGMRFEAYFEE